MTAANGSPPGDPDEVLEVDPERVSLERQTARNLRGMELERAGELDAAIELYEQNLREGFEADWPYGRLVSIFERRGQPLEAIRALERGMEVFTQSERRTPQDRRAVISIFRNRIGEITRKMRQAEREAAARERLAKREALARERLAKQEAAAQARLAKREAAEQRRRERAGGAAQDGA